MRYLVLPLVLLALAVSATAAPEDFSAPPPATLKKLGERLERLAMRLRTLIEEASKDPDERKIDIYNAYTSQELKLKRRQVRASDLAGYMVDATKNWNVRVKAQKAIHLGAFQRGDPDLSTVEKQGRKSKRAYFCDKQLIKHLRSEDDPKTRVLVHELLLKLWRVNNVPEISNYNPNDKDTWRKAYLAWQKYLSRN
jgi:hypothetical protein